MKVIDRQGEIGSVEVILETCEVNGNLFNTGDRVRIRLTPEQYTGIMTTGKMEARLSDVKKR